MNLFEHAKHNRCQNGYCRMKQTFNAQFQAQYISNRREKNFFEDKLNVQFRNLEYQIDKYAGRINIGPLSLSTLAMYVSESTPS